MARLLDSFWLAGEHVELLRASDAAELAAVDWREAQRRLLAARDELRVCEAVAHALNVDLGRTLHAPSDDALWSDLEAALRVGALVLVVHEVRVVGGLVGPDLDAVALTDLAEPADEEPADEATDVEPQISFARAGVRRGGRGAVGGERRTVAVPPVPAAVLGYLGRWSKPPPVESLVRVHVTHPTEMTVTLSAEGGDIELELSGVEGAGMAVSKKRVLPWFGDAADLDGASWDGIELLDVSAGGDLPFGLRIEATCGSGSGTLGVFDVLFADPSGGPARSARYGLFKTREPAAKFVLPELDVSKVRVLLDDGEDATADTLDVTEMVALDGDVTSFDFPAWVEREDGPPGEVNEDVGRRRIVDFDEVDDVDEPDGDCALFMLGENRLQILLDDELLLYAHSFHYVDDALTVPSGYDPMELLDAVDESGAVEVIKGSLTVDFVDDTDDATISAFFRAAGLRPCSFAPHYKIVEGRVDENIDHTALVQRVDELQGYEEEVVESLGITPVAPTDPHDAGVLERIPRAFHADFNPVNDTFANAARHWHHFVIHTFPAHRLIEEVLLPRGRPTIVALSGVQFDTNKTFVRPAAFDSLRRIVELYDEDPSRKLATFGHTDAVGDAGYNEGLSLARARAVDTLLRHKSGFWFDRFAKHNEVVSRAPGDQQWVLHRLGYSALLPSELEGVDEGALHSFQSDHALTEGTADYATRVALAGALRTKINAAAEPLAFEDSWGTKELQHMLKHLGHYAGTVNGFHGASMREAVGDLQRGEGLGVDGDVGIVTRVALIDAYLGGMVTTDLDPSRFHPGAVFGCGEAFPVVPTADGVASQQNRRVEVVFRREAVEPIDPPNQLGPACLYVQWQQPEMAEDREAELPNVVIACGDSGLGRGALDNYSGDAQRNRNRLMINGERLIRPTDVTNASSGTPNAHTVAATGDLSRLRDGSGHGTAVMTCMASDGIGDNVGGAPRTVQTAVLGVAPHVKLRPIRKPNRFFNNLLCLEIVASDPDVFAYSTSSHLYRAGMTAAQRRALQERLQDMCAQGKVALASAGNYRSAYTGEYDTATREFGGQAPDRRVSRKHASYGGAEAHRPRILIVGSSEQVSQAGVIGAPGQRDTVANHTYLGEQVGIHTPGVNICAASPLSGSMGTLNNNAPANGYSIGGISGTSFATPMTAGIVGELMMLDGDLTQPANLPRALEYVEATADALPNVNAAGGQGGPANPRNADPGPNAGGPVNGPQSPTAASTYQNIRRVHFWKAVLAALNKGLSAEGRGSAGATDPLFQHCTLIDDANTQWYGFEIRSPTPNALLYWRKPDGTMVPVHDEAALFPTGVTRGATWRLTDLSELAPGQPLPAYPWTRANFTAAGRTPYYLCQLSIKRDALADYAALVVYMPDIDPLDPGGVAGPPILEIPVADRDKLRDPAAQAADADARIKSLATFVRFADFVVFGTAVPQPVDHFVFVAEDRRDDAGVGESLSVLLFAVDAFGNIGVPGPISTNVTHNGTAGAAGSPNAGVFLNAAPTATTGVAPTFGAGADHPGVARLRFQGFTQEAVTLSFDDGAGHTGSITIDVRPAGPLSQFNLELRRRGGGASVVDTPLKVGEAFELEVTAVDSGGVTVTSFSGDVTLSLLTGEMGSDGPPARGLHVKTADADAFDPAAFTMSLASGVGVFPLFCYTAGPLHVQVEDDTDNTGQSRQIEIEAGPLAQFRVLAETPQTTGNAFNVEVTALDGNGNVLTDYEGQVALAVGATGTAGATAADGTRSGAHIQGTQTAADDNYTFSHTDSGVHNFVATCYTAETLTFVATESGGARGESSNVEVRSTGLDHFGFEVTGADRAGTSFSLTVNALDADGNRVADYTGTVTLSLARGTAFVAGPPQSGVQIGPAVSRTMTSADHGSFTFTITPHTAETIRFSATDGTVTTEGDDIDIESGAMENFVVTAPASAARRTPFSVRVEARDADGNVVPAFAGPVTLTAARNGLAQRDFRPRQVHTFHRADNGVFTYTVQLSRRGTYVIQATDGNQTNVSSAVTIT